MGLLMRLDHFLCRYGVDAATICRPKATVVRQRAMRSVQWLQSIECGTPASCFAPSPDGMEYVT